MGIIVVNNRFKRCIVVFFMFKMHGGIHIYMYVAVPIIVLHVPNYYVNLTACKYT